MAGNYAEGTTVATSKSLEEIKSTLIRFGANRDTFAYAEMGRRVAIQFRVVFAVHDGRRAKDHVEQPQPHQGQHEQREGARADRFIGKSCLIGPGHHRQSDADDEQP